MSCNKEICFYSNWSWDPDMVMNLNIKSSPKDVNKAEVGIV